MLYADVYAVQADLLSCITISRPVSSVCPIEYSPGIGVDQRASVHVLSRTVNR